MHHQDCWVRRDVGWIPPAVKMRLTALVRSEANGIESEVNVRGGMRYRVGRRERELPLAVVEETAKRDIPAQCRHGNNDAERLQDPARVDRLGMRGSGL